jgi:ribonuclease Z
MDMWLLGRSVSLDIFGLGDTLKRVKTLLDLYGWNKWPGFFPVNFHPLSEEQNHLFLQDDDLRITSSPACHLIPTIALKFDSLRTGKSLAYSCDTEPCQAVIDLACNADILIHESSGESKGHTSPEQAGQIATQAKVGALYLIHYPVGSSYRPDAWIKHAQQSFAGEVVLAQDFMKVEF